MIKRNFYKLLLVFLSIAFLVSLFFNYQYYQYHKQADTGSSIYMNDFYYEIDDAVYVIDQLVEGNTQNIDSSIAKLTNNLAILEHMLGRVPYYIPDNQGARPTDIKNFNTIINHGTDYEGHYIPPFIEDNKIDEKEKAFLSDIKDRLKPTRDLLRSKDKKKKEVNPDISFEEFQDIISETIYGKLKYRNVLEKYIDATDQ